MRRVTAAIPGSPHPEPGPEGLSRRTHDRPRRPIALPIRALPAHGTILVNGTLHGRSRWGRSGHPANLAREGPDDGSEDELGVAARRGRARGPDIDTVS